jgi:hypothetical protein
MSVDTSAITMMVEPNGQRVWIESGAFVEYLRMIERRGRQQADAALESRDLMTYAGLMAIQDTVRQIADSIVVTSMSAQDAMRGGQHGS